MQIPENPPTPEQSKLEPMPDAPLVNLIDLLIHRPGKTEQWLEAISESLPSQKSAFGRIGEIMYLSAELGVQKETTRKVITAIVARDTIEEWPAHLLDGIYQEVYTRQENQRRRKQGLPRLAS